MIPNYNPDVLTCLANLSNDEVFTPPDVANRMLDLLPSSLWSDPHARFLDPGSKTGVFLREIARRLMAGLAEQIPDVQERADHIFKEQLFGLAITELTGLLSRRSVYCSKTANGHYSVCTAFDDEQGNILYEPAAHTWVNGRCRYCGASREVYDRSEVLESHAYRFIHADNPEFLFPDMRFDVIIGNPPYQLSDGGFGKSAKPIYHLFIEQAKKLNPQYILMIIPDRWFAGGKGLDEFRTKMLGDNHIKYLVDYTNANDVFPGVDIPGGICYFLRDRTYYGDCEVTTINNGVQNTAKRKLNQFDTFVRYNESATIISKVKSRESIFFDTQVSSRKPFGLATNVQPLNKGDIQLVYNGGQGFYWRKDITTGTDLIDKWKVITSKVSYDHAGQPDKDGKRRVLSRLEILPPNVICSETYIILGAYTNRNDADNMVSYMKCRFTRFLIAQLSFSQDITKDRFAFVPIQDFSESWTDEKLYKKYNLSDDEINFVESMIKPIE